MEVEIGDVMSTVRAVDGDALLAPETLEKIVRAVLLALRDREEHRERVRAEQRVSPGVSHERDQDDEGGF